MEKGWRPKILFVSYAFYPSMGGIEVNSILFSEYFYRFGANLKLVTMTQEKGEKEFPFPVIRKPGLRQLFALHQWADIVFEHNPSLRLGWPRFFFKSKSIVVICGRISREDKSYSLQGRIKLYGLRKTTAVIAVSQAIANESFPKAKIILNPYRDAVFKNEQTIRQPLSFAFMGRLVSEKGVDIALKAMYKLINDHNLKPTLKIIGDGPEREKLIQKVVEYNLVDQVTFMGIKKDDELNDILNSCKYLLVPSFNEAFGNVAIEGMASGCLPFVSDNGGLPEAIGDAGVTFKVKSVDHLVERILEIINNPDLEESYRKKMLSHLINFKAENVLKSYWKIITTIYKSK